MIGQTISHYRITDKLGEGGMGVVYKALDTTLDRHVAIKFLPSHLQSDHQAKTRFVHEAKAASALNHANIAVVHEIDETPDDGMFIVMACYEGRTLKDKMRSGALSLDDTIAIVSQIASGLGTAHEKDILHRDVKPANILMGDDGHAKLADFGLAKLAGRTQMTKTGSTLGTTSYLSPEQASGGEVDHRSDIFSLGVVFYELLTGKRPFRGDHDAAVLYGIMNHEPAPLASLRSDLPPGLQGIIDRVLCKNPVKRYQNANELLDDLEALGGDGPIPGSRTSRRRFSMTRGLLALATMAVVAAGGLTGYQRLNGTPQSTPAPGDDKTFVIAVAPFWGQNADALEEGKVMQALIERRLVEELGNEETVTILGKRDITDAPQSNDEAKALGEKQGATIVLWGEVLVLRGEVEIQPYLTNVRWFRGQSDLLPTGMQTNLDGANQLGQRKAQAHDVGTIALQVAGAYYRTKDKDRALAILRRIDPPTPQSLYQMGVLFLNRGEMNEAERVVRQAHEIWPEDPRSNWGMGNFHSWQGDKDTAVIWYKKAIEIDSTYANAYAGLSMALVALGEYGEAIRWLEDAMILFPESYAWYVNMASVYSRQGQYDVARKWVEKSLDFADNPASLANSYIFIGALHRYQGENDEGQRWYEKALELDPEHWMLYGNIGNIQYEQGHYEEAIQWYERGAALNWGGANAQFAVSYMMLDRYAEAIQVFSRLLEMKPRDLNNPLLYTICLNLVGEKDKADDYIASRAGILDDEAWIAPVIRFYAGEITENEVLEMAEAEDPEKDTWQKCEAFYYLGMAKLLGMNDQAEPDSTGARLYFEKCVSTGVEDYWEFKLAGKMVEPR
jgi:serine/threonine-protein kinase